jgi:AcrR family transcriptional regulator
MSDVSDRAGLSRGTVYRYFPTKEDLLAVLAQYEQDRFADGLRSRLATVPAEDLSLGIIVEYIISYLRQHPALPLMIDVEPEFVLTFLRRQMPVFHRITEELIGPVIADARPIREGWLTQAELNDLLLRVVLSVFLVPGESGITEGVMEGALDSFLRLATAADKPSRLGRRRPA